MIGNCESCCFQRLFRPGKKIERQAKREINAIDYTQMLGAILTKDSAAIILVKESIFVLIKILKTWI